jgi:uncharacterized RDD family membrane protein YckC
MRWRELKKKTLSSKKAAAGPSVRYAGFWSRVLAFVTDIFMIGLPVSLLIMLVFGHDQMESAGAMDVILQTEAAKSKAPDPLASLTQFVLFLLIYTFFWKTSGQTPGKKMARIKVVDAKTFELASWPQLVLRFLGYFLSLVTIVGFFIGLFRKDKRTLHDLISRTAVIAE